MLSTSATAQGQLQNQTKQPRDAQMWLTTADRSAMFTRQAEALHFSESSNSLPSVDVNDMAQYQIMDGFGVALTGGSAQLLMQMDAAQRSALLKQLFTTQGDGIGISYLRVSIGSSDMNDHPFSYDDLPAGVTDVDLAKFNLGPDRTTVIPVLKEILAIDPGIKIFGSPWSAPAWMKTNDSLKGGHLKPEYYGVYAKYFVKYIEAMKAEGITIHAVTIQNEPLNPKNTPSMVMFAQEEGAFIANYLGPTFQRAAINAKIWLYDHNPDVPSYPLSILANPDASKYVDGTAFHLYGGTAATFMQAHEEYPNKNLYMTEQSVTQRPGDGPLNIDEPVEEVLIGSTRNWSRNVLLWNLAADPNAGPHTNDGGCTGCRGAITLDGNNVTRNVAYYALEHFSKFVRPGSVRVASSELEQLATVAFITPDGKVVLVVSNTSNFPQKFNVRYHSELFTTTIPEESVGTYVW
jgi:glucosylceramidase